MEQTLLQSPEAKPPKLTIDWTESDWFQVWLRLAKRDYQGNASADQETPSAIACSAAA